MELAQLFPGNCFSIAKVLLLIVSLNVMVFLLVEVTSIEILSQNFDELWFGFDGKLLIIIRSPSTAVKTLLNELSFVSVGISCRRFKSSICC